jgi:hypothetical protein
MGATGGHLPAQLNHLTGQRPVIRRVGNRTPQVVVHQQGKWPQQRQRHNHPQHDLTKQGFAAWVLRHDSMALLNVEKDDNGALSEAGVFIVFYYFL